MIEFNLKSRAALECARTYIVYLLRGVSHKLRGGPRKQWKRDVNRLWLNVRGVSIATFNLQSNFFPSIFG